MSESNKKFALLSQLDNIIDNNGVNDNIYEYDFYDIDTIILNNVEQQIKDDCNVHITLHFDELIVEIYKDDKLCNSYSLPYMFFNSLHLIGGNL